MVGYQTTLAIWNGERESRSAGVVRYALGYLLWTAGTGAILAATIFNMMDSYRFGIGGRATAWPAGVLIAGLVGLVVFPICVALVRSLGLGNPDRALSVSALRVGTVGPVLLIIGASFTLLAYFDNYDETLVVIFTISAMYPLAAWRIFRAHPMPSDSDKAIRRGATILGFVWIMLGAGITIFWLAGILSEWSYFSGRWVWRLVVGVMLIHVLSGVTMHLVGRFIRGLRPFAISSGWTLGSFVVTAAPVFTVYLGLVGIEIFWHIE